MNWASSPTEGKLLNNFRIIQVSFRESKTFKINTLPGSVISEQISNERIA